MTVRRSLPLPWMMIMLRDGSARTVPGLAAKLSSSFITVGTDTCCSETTEMPYPASGSRPVSMPPVPTASFTGIRRYPCPSLTSTTLLARSAFSRTNSMSLRGTGRPEARLTVP